MKKLLSKKQWRLGIIVSSCVLLILGLFYFFSQNANTNGGVFKESISETKPLPRMEFGFPIDSFSVDRHEVRKGETFSNILTDRGVPASQLFAIAAKAQDELDLRKIRPGRIFHFYTSKKDSTEILKKMVYQEDALNYVLIHLGDSIVVERREKEVQVRNRRISATIHSSLYRALQEQNVSLDLVMTIADLYAWSIDFFRIQPGDKFAVEYEEIWVDDTVFVGAGKILASRFYHAGKEYDAYRFEKDDLREYYDLKGRSLKKAFLKAPLNFFRISSKYNRTRFHPVLKRVKPHLGTDYAAPSGTPIMTTADGVIERSGYTSGNGNYVKVRHNSTYSTQYLHMRKIARGMGKGARVRQGDIIGYVGSTGLATGPHVCYRFWKNGRQVDPLKEDLPEAKTINEDHLPAFKLLTDKYSKRLDELMKREFMKEMDLAGMGTP